MFFFCFVFFFPESELRPQILGVNNWRKRQFKFVNLWIINVLYFYNTGDIFSRYYFVYGIHLLFLYSLTIYTSQNKELSNWDFYENSSRLYGQKKSFSKPRERLHTMIPPATATQLEMFVSVMIMFTQVARSRKMVDTLLSWSDKNNFRRIHVRYF